ncbi:paired amphipathic helix protein Sin3a-like [Schistocerca cancellata]|uniref:paired amphipathic helix protein Sin3a-like n=1 Tax=Schistocerca cancellata TaxID=274614 RepID=UPI002119B6F0|nr:paired amphipathic helix protein Sin3a-like [Schistocerca cancellata]XP_049777831.1 paired amphipathic helix protein Sin3a-like [Schistocerca cancellata]
MPTSVQLTVPSYSNSVIANGGGSPPPPPQQPSRPKSSQPQPQAQAQQPQYQRLKVEDALSYLDQVKYKFGSQPQVYNEFLDIMKEFKSQSIDTPGVIQRVSNLFKGHPELIVGFNTFLPPGYKIEVQPNNQGYTFQVSVSMPSSVIGVPATAVVPSGRPSSPTNTPVPPPSFSTVPAPAVAATSSVAPKTPPQQQLQQSPAHSISPLPDAQSAQSQPVEFGHAINYVNKIKKRFISQPEKYKRFLEILHTYQKEQKNVKDGQGHPTRHLTEAEVYAQVARLFQNQEDLLAEFGQFLPDATSHHSTVCDRLASAQTSNAGSNNKVNTGETVTPLKKNSGSGKPAHDSSVTRDSHETPVVTEHRSSTASISHVKSTPMLSPRAGSPPPKRHKTACLRDVSIAEAAKYGNLTDYAFFDKVRKALKNQEVYENFLRCLILFNEEIVSRSELVQLVTPFLGKFPELFRWFKDFVGVTKNSAAGNGSGSSSATVESIPSNVVRQDRPAGDLAMEIDYTACKRLGASYCALPKNYIQPKCSGRTALCKEVLNDTWVSFPNWSEDSTFVTSRKTQFEKYIYRCEDERFELDVVIETNAATIRVLQGVNKKLSRMSPEEAAKFHLDDCLGGFSPTIHQRAIRRIYGDKADDVIDGLKKNPTVAVPVVLRRLKAKEEEWREAQKGFNKIWREQNEKYYLKSLDHQGINFKQNDLKVLRSKSLFNEIETIYEERHDQADEGTGEVATGPHLILQYKDKSMLDDAANLLIHHVKRQTGIQSEDKQRVKQLLRQLLPDMFFHPRQEPSDDEQEDDEEDDRCKPNGDKPSSSKKNKMKGFLHAPTGPSDEAYTLFFANGNWYLFLRLHHILCERLTKIYDQAVILAAEEAKERQDRKESTAVTLRLKPKSEIDVEDYYPTFLDMVKNVLDGNMDSNAYEDTLREMFGIHAYIAFTLDKVVTYAVRQLQHIVSDSTCQKCIELLRNEAKRDGAGGPCHTAAQRAAAEQMYQRRAERLMGDEVCYKVLIYRRDCRMTIELLDNDTEEPDPPAEVEKWSTYIERFTNPGGTADKILDATSRVRSRKPVFLARNVRLWRQHSGSLAEKNRDKVHEKSSPDGEVETSKSDRGNAKDGKGKIKPNSSDDEKSPSAGGSRDKVHYADNSGEIVGGDGMQCRFNINQYRMVFVVNKENYLYKRQALRKARTSHQAVSLHLSEKFQKWLNNWVEKNVTDQQHAACKDWLLGRGEDVVSNQTRVLSNNNLNMTPYHPYNRYRVEYLETSDKK